MQLEQALGVAEKDTKDASSGVMKDLRRFQSEKEDDLRRYMVSIWVFLVSRASLMSHRWNSHNVI